MFCQRAWSYQKGYKQHFNECWHSSIHPPIHPSNHPSNHSFINPSIHLHAIHFVLTWRNWPFPEIKYSTFLSFCCSAAVSGSELCAGRLCWSHQIVKKKTRYLGKCDITGMLLIFTCENTNIVRNLSAPIWLWRLYWHYLPAQVESDKH